MNLADLLQPWLNITHQGCEILGLHNDSRQIKKQFLFLAYPGVATDGRFFIPQAMQAGAVAVVYEPDNWPSHCTLPDSILAIPLPGLAKILPALASRFYDYPAKKLILTGVTGTNGKTTVAYQLAQAHAKLEGKAAYIGTLGQGEVSLLHPLTNTTPDALCLQRLLFEYQQQHIRHVDMEVSSHALCQQRVAGIEFDQAIFTNLTHDHLDYHQTMEAYANAKASLFTQATLQAAIINRDDPYALIMQAGVNKSCRLITYGVKHGADVRAVEWDISLAGTKIEVESPWGRHFFTINALGFFNVYNALAVFSSLLTRGYSINSVIEVMSELHAAPGRMEIVARDPYILVDYAHTPAALENVLTTLMGIKKGRILVVFGCGGNRDEAKRPIMGKIASQYADVVIITSDNPRHEEPQAIMDAIEAGVIDSSSVYKIMLREEAIAKALELAEQDDLIVIAGKGHEPYQQIGDVYHPFSDQEVIRRLRE